MPAPKRMFVRRRRRRPWRALAALVVVAVAVGAAAVYLGDDGPRRGRSAAQRLARAGRTFATLDPVRRACALDDEQLVRLWRGNHPRHSEDVTLVPQEPNYMGAFDLTSHSGPWDYLQRIPLVLYGPQRIRAAGRVEGAANLVDVYATMGALTGVDLPPSDGRDLDDALRRGVDGIPRLVVTVVWDGVGRNTLDVWDGRWPTLARMERDGASYVDATVGSSPSITPASHGSLGTGAWPRTHGVTAIEYRGDEGRVVQAIGGRDPAALDATTFADAIDAALGNAPKVGLLGFNNWHIPMMGHGLGAPGGDADELAIVGVQARGDISGNDDLYTTPGYLLDGHGLARYAAELDREDGRVDDAWLGHDIVAKDHNPAWVRYARDVMLEMIEGGGYGGDDVTDFFFVNFKMTDIAGHEWSIDSREMAAVLEEQDAALGALLDYLDRRVRDYVVVLTSDHGHTRSTRVTGAWPIRPGVFRDDVEAHFGVRGDEDLFDGEGAYGLYVDRAVMRRHGVTLDAIARFANAYTVHDNWGAGPLPDGYEERADEHVFAAAYPTRDLPEVMRCKFDAPRPPRDARA
ncbi:MAG TPA: alkaline phosphatase family protein [Actinomycetota bacterium]|nr:alkaline phosphatase family protein [Actinomycetota bacterium]